MTQPTLLTLLTERETAARLAVERLRAQIVSLDEQLTAAETEMTELAITRKTLLSLGGPLDTAAPADPTLASPAYQQILAVFHGATIDARQGHLPSAGHRHHRQGHRESPRQTQTPRRPSDPDRTRGRPVHPRPAVRVTPTNRTSNEPPNPHRTEPPEPPSHTFALRLLIYLTQLALGDGRAQQLPMSTLLDHMSGNPLLQVQRRFGHASPATTYRYIRYLKDPMRDVDEAFRTWTAAGGASYADIARTAMSLGDGDAAQG